MPALPSSILEPLRVQVSALLPVRQVDHPLACHRRRRIPDRIIFDKLIQLLAFGCGYRRIADHTCSATTLRRRDEWMSAGVVEHLRMAVLVACDQMIGLEPEDLAVDGCITKAPRGGRTAGRSPVDRGKQGPSRLIHYRWPGRPRRRPWAGRLAPSRLLGHTRYAPTR